MALNHGLLILLVLFFFLLLLHIKHTPRGEEMIEVNLWSKLKRKTAYWPLFVLPRYQEYLPYQRVRTSFPRPRYHSRRHQRWRWTPPPLRYGILPRLFPAQNDVHPVFGMASRERRINVGTLCARNCRNCIWKDNKGQKKPPEDRYRRPVDCKHAGPMASRVLKKFVWA